MTKEKTKKVAVRDLKPSADAKGGHGHHGHRQVSSGRRGGTDNVERAGKYWL